MLISYKNKPDINKGNVSVKLMHMRSPNKEPIIQNTSRHIAPDKAQEDSRHCITSDAKSNTFPPILEAETMLSNICILDTSINHECNKITN